jgi:hypothetical protein
MAGNKETHHGDNLTVGKIVITREAVRYYVVLVRQPMRVEDDACCISNLIHLAGDGHLDRLVDVIEVGLVHPSLCHGVISVATNTVTHLDCAM